VKRRASSAHAIPGALAVSASIGLVISLLAENSVLEWCALGAIGAPLVAVAYALSKSRGPVGPPR
jgi:hypothetical protein